MNNLDGQTENSYYCYLLKLTKVIFCCIKMRYMHADEGTLQIEAVDFLTTPYYGSAFGIFYTVRKNEG